MNWKQILKYSFIFYGIFLIFGFIYSIIIYGLKRIIFYYNSVIPYWIVAIIGLILIPFIYSFFIKKSYREIAVIILLFIFISSVIAIPMMGVGQNMISKSGGKTVLPWLIAITFEINPLTLTDSPICIPYVERQFRMNWPKDVEPCPFHKYGFTVQVIILSFIAFIIIFVSMILGNFISNRKESISQPSS